MARLSVVIPTYNRRESLLLTLKALARQTLPPTEFEVVVISDGATDGTREAIESLITDYPLNFCEQGNQGPSVARNQGARLAKNPLLVYIDDDIEPVDCFLEEHLKSQEGQENLVVIGPQSGPENEAMSNWVAWEHQMLQKQYANFVAGVWEAGPNNLYSGNFSILREHLLGIGGFNEKFTRQEDVELGFRLSHKGMKFCFNPRSNGIHRPTRSFSSWYKTPFEYGRRDVQMAREGDEKEVVRLARMHYQERNIITRSLAHLCIGRPFMESLILNSGCHLVQHSPRKIALKVCSMLFNLRYLQGMSEELGGRNELWTTLKVNASPGAD